MFIVKKIFRHPACVCHAFSLVEMLMALLVASLLMAALAPVMTRRMNGEMVNFNGMSHTDAIPSCAYVNDNSSEFTADDCHVPRGMSHLSAIIVSGGGGGGGAIGQIKDEREQSIAKNFNTGRDEITEIYGGVGAGNTVNKSFVIDNTMSDIWIELIGGGGPGGDGMSIGGYPASQSDCGSWGYYVDYTVNAKKYPNGTIQHSTCIAKYNPGDGDSNSPKRNINGVTSAAAGNSCSASSSGNCCWYGKTSDDGCNSSSNYNSCTRTVCQWSAAKKICSAWRPGSVQANNGDYGRMPTLAELEILARNAKNLQICGTNTHIAGTPFTKCSGIANTCIGASSTHSQNVEQKNYCDATQYFANDGEAVNNTHSTVFMSDTGGYLYYSSFLANPLNIYELYNPGYLSSVASTKDTNSALSVRCVIDNVQEFKAYRGGGGEAGQYARMKIPDEVLKRAFLNDDGSIYNGVVRLDLSAGHGGKNTETKSQLRSGQPSVARLYKGNKIIWIFGLSMNTGSGGLNATDAKHGDASHTSGAYCIYRNYLYDEFDKQPTANDGTTGQSVYTNCVNIGILDEIRVGNALGLSGKDGGHGGIPSVGWGGSRPVSTSKTIGGLASVNGHSNPDLNGQNGISPGAGGSGGACKQGPKRTLLNCGKGGDGGGGAARFTFKRAYPGAGGGGGGGGSVVHVKNIPVTENALIKVQVGHGGSGGNKNGGNGVTGGTSFIELENGIRYEVMGGQGGSGANGAIIASATLAQGGNGGSAGSIPQSTLDRLTLQENKDAIINGSSGIKAEDSNLDVPYRFKGGNGGYNSKTTPLAGNSGIPCGGFSTIAIGINNKKYECGSKDIPTNSVTPTPLLRSLIAHNIEQNISQYINIYAPGATGGGGGAWNITPGANEQVGAGATGMGGYVIIYFR